MSLEDGDIVRATLVQHNVLVNVPILNVFWYVVSDVTGAIDTPEAFTEIAGDIFEHNASRMRVVQSTQHFYDGCNIENMSNLVDIGTYTYAGEYGGLVSSVAEPTQVALSFKLIRGTKLTRNGSKRVGGVADSLVTDTDGQNLATSTAIIDIQEAFVEQIDVGGIEGWSATLKPIIARRVPPATPVTVYQPVIGCVFRGLGSQNTRKRLL